MVLLRLVLSALILACAAPAQEKKCAGPDVAFSMANYAYLARLRCIDGRDVIKNARTITGVRRDGCYADVIQIQCVDDPKWTQVMFIQGQPPPPVPLGFRQISEDGFVAYSNADNAIAKNDYASALDWLDRAAASDPEMAFVHRRRGFVLFKLNQLDDARLAYERALKLAPGALSYRLDYGTLLMAQRDPAANAYLAQLDHDAPADWPQRPELYCRLSQTDKANATAHKKRSCDGGFKPCCT